MTMVKVNHPFSKTVDSFVHELFNELPVNFGKKIRQDLLQFPPVNIVEKDNSYELELAAPGWNKADFNIKLEGNLLHISAEKKEETKSETDKVVRREFSRKSFSRSFTLDDKINAEAIAARYDNGVLVLELPKKEEAKAGSKEISIL
jgi:HSP20 family protein